MNLVNKIVFIENTAQLSQKVIEMAAAWAVAVPEVVRLQRIEKSAVQDADCIIIDAALMKDIKNDIGELRKYYSKKIICTFDVLNHPNAHLAILYGADVFYEHAAITSLMYKIYDTYSPEKAMPETISCEQAKKAGQSNFIAVYSPKGGTGKTCTSINLAIQYAQKGLKVLLLDFAQFGGIGINLKILHKGTGLSRLLSAMEDAAENLSQAKLEVLAKESIYNYTNESIQFDVLIAAAPLKMEKTGAAEVEAIIRVCRDLDYDVMIADTSSEISQRNLAVLELADQIAFVSSPDVISGWSLLQFKEILRSLGIKSRSGLIVNMYLKSLGFSCRELEKELDIPLICAVPACEEIQRLGNIGQAIGTQKKHGINIYFRRIAHYYVPVFGKKEIMPKKLGLF